MIQERVLANLKQWKGLFLTRSGFGAEWGNPRFTLEHNPFDCTLDLKSEASPRRSLDLR